MAAYHPATFRALPLRHLLFQEHLHTIPLHIFQVRYHAHMVEGAIALIEGLQMLTGEIPAFIAKPHQPFPQQFTLSFVMTIPPARQTPGTVRPPKPLSFQVVLHRQVAGTQAAVHPARSN